MTRSKNPLLFLLILALSLNGCAALPGGGPEPSDAQINAEAAKAYAEVKAKSKRSTNREWNDMVQRVATRIAAASGENFQWEYILIDSPEKNAWCMPGGKIAVYTGIMPVLKNEAALAAVLGHEVAHATQRHGKQRYARAIKENQIGMLAGLGAAAAGMIFCKTNECRILAGLGGAAVGVGVAFFGRKFSREDETDADRYGQIYMARAGYDPSEASRLWERMDAASGGQAPPEWMSTHPSNTSRQQNLISWLPEANSVYQRAPQRFGLGSSIR